MPRPTLSVSVTVVVRGGVIQVTVTNFRAGTRVVITIQSVEQEIGAVVTDQQGRGTTSVTVPTNIELGPHTLSAKGLDLSGNPAVVTAGITVVAPLSATGGNGILGITTRSGTTTSGSTTSGSLAKTGAVVLPTAAVGVALVAGGVLLRRSAKKRKVVAV